MKMRLYLRKKATLFRYAVPVPWMHVPGDRTVCAPPGFGSAFNESVGGD